MTVQHTNYKISYSIIHNIHQTVKYFQNTNFK